MTTSPVVSVTDELVAELEALANECGQHGANWYEQRHMAAFPEYPCDQDFVVAASPATILSLLAERAELRRDAKRYKKLRTVTPYRFKKIQDSAIADGGDVFYLLADRFDAALDESSDGLASEYVE